MAVPKKKKSKS